MLANGEQGNRVSDYVTSRKLPVSIRLLPPESTRTSRDAAEILNCSVAEIAKTVAFITKNSDASILVVLSGDKKVDLKKLEASFKRSTNDIAILRKMTAEEVKERTGYSIGGVPPFPHNDGVIVLADESLFRFESVWGAAGTPSSVMQIPPKLLTDLMKYGSVNVSE